MNFLLFIFTCLSTFYCQAQYQDFFQRNAGIYPTLEDFEKNKIENGFKPYSKNYSIWPTGFFQNKDIILTTPDTSIIYPRSEIFAYKDHKDRLIRIFNNKHYKVVCERGMIIYSIYCPSQSSFHFSKSFATPIYRLTKKNIQLVFVDHPEIWQKINSVKKKDWLNREQTSEHFLINELYLNLLTQSHLATFSHINNLLF